MKTVRKGLCLLFLAGLAMSVLTGCPIAPKAIDMKEYFDNQIVYQTYVLDSSEDAGYKLYPRELQYLDLSALIDNDENNIELKNYTGFDFTAKSAITKLKIKSISFVLQVESDIEMRFKVYVGTDEYIDKTVSATQAKKNIITLSFDVPYEYTSAAVSKGLSIRLDNKLEVGEIKYSVDTFLIDAEEKK